MSILMIGKSTNLKFSAMVKHTFVALVSKLSLGDGVFAPDLIPANRKSRLD